MSVRGTAAAGSIDSLTSLRFFAALYVLLFHSGASYIDKAVPQLGFLRDFFTNGYLGVSFFFILSGFILAYVYDGKLRDRTDLKRYAMARFARVYPVYLLALLLVLPLILKDPSWRAIPQFVLLHCWVPFGDLRSLQNINFPGWSLSVELAFYMLFPLLLAGLSRLGRRGLVLAAAVACAPMLALRLPSLNAGVIPPFAFVNEVPFMLLRVPEFAYGVALGLLYRRDPLLFRSAWLTPVAVIVTFAALVSTGSPWIAPVAAVLFGILIAAVATNRDSFVSRLLSNRLLLLGGGASYAIYILQFPVRYWIGQVFTGDLNMLGRLAYAPALIVISTLVFLYFEEPVREWLRRKVSLPPSQGDKVAGTVAPGQPPAAQARESANSQ